MARVLTLVAHVVSRDDGQDLIEYGLLMALIAIAAVVAVTTVGQQINTVLWQTIANNF